MKIKRMAKMLLCLVLALSMLVSMVPVYGAGATESVETNAVQSTTADIDNTELSATAADEPILVYLNKVSENHYTVDTETTDATIVSTYAMNGEMVFEIDDATVKVSGEEESEVYYVELKADASEYSMLASIPEVTLTAANTSDANEKEAETQKPIKTVKLTATRENAESFASTVSYTIYDSSRTAGDAKPVETGEITIEAGATTATKDVKYTYADGSKEAEDKAAGLAYVEYAPVENCKLKTDENGSSIGSTYVLMNNGLSTTCTYNFPSSAISLTGLTASSERFRVSTNVYGTAYISLGYQKTWGGTLRKNLTYNLDISSVLDNYYPDYDSMAIYYSVSFLEPAGTTFTYTVKYGDQTLSSSTSPLTSSMDLAGFANGSKQLQISIYFPNTVTDVCFYQNIHLSKNAGSDFEAVIPTNSSYKPGDVVPILIRNCSDWFTGNELSVCVTPEGSETGTVCSNVLATLGGYAVVFGYTVPDDFTGGTLNLTDLKVGDSKVTFVNDEKAVQDVNLSVGCLVDYEYKPMGLNIDNAYTASEGGSRVLKFPVESASAVEWMYTDFDTEAEEPYLRSMYAIKGNSTERLPIYIHLDSTKENIEYLYVKTDSIPSGEIAPLHFFYLPGSNTDNTDYVKSETPLRDAALEYSKYFVTIITGNSVEYETDESDETKPAEGLIEITYNDSWTYYAAESDVPEESRTNVISKIRADYYTKHIDTGNPETTYGALTLSYNTKVAKESGEKYTYGDPSYFSWTSSDESIATIESTVVEGKLTGVVALTGKTGTVTFTLTCSNGKHPVSVVSKSLTVSESPDPYLYVPSTSETVTTRLNMSATIGFISNITQQNVLQAAKSNTTYTLNVYTGSNTTGTPVYTTSDTSIASVQTVEDEETAVVEKSVTAFTIPENTLVAVGTYTAVICVDYEGPEDSLGLAEGYEKVDNVYRFTCTSEIKVKSQPVSLTMTRSTESVYVLDTAHPTVSWTSENSTADTAWKYVVADSEGNELASNTGTGAVNGSYAFTQETPDECLKKVYTVTVYATNDAEEDGWTVASTMLYIYNGDVLDILIHESEHLVNGTVTDSDNATLDNRSLIRGWLSDDGKTVDLETYGLSVAELQNLVQLSTVISLNTGNYEWGNVSDQINWTAEHSSEDTGVFYYHQDSQYVSIDALELPSVFPTGEFLEQGTADGTVTITATHSKTGQSTSAELQIDTLKDEFYLFQFIPRTETTMEYWDKNGEKHTVYSDDKGQLALFEENGIDETKPISAKSSYTETEYMGIVEPDTLISGENDAVQNELYGVNIVRLVKAGMVEFTFVNSDGRIYANKDVIVRGGVYCDGEYVTAADLFHVGSEEGNIGDPNWSNGLNDDTYTTDSNGKITIKFNLQQITESGNLTDHDVLYVFEIRCSDGKYRPAVVRVQDDSPKAIVKLTAADEPEAFFNLATLRRYDKDGNLRTDELSESGQTARLGPNAQYTRAEVEYETVLWQRTDIVESDNADGLPSTLSKNNITQYFCYEKPTGNPVMLGDEVNTQSSEVWIYPFSTIPLVTTKINLDADGFGVTENGTSTGKTWLESGADITPELYIQDDEQASVKMPFPYRFYNGIGTIAPSNSYQVMSNIGLLFKDLSTDLQDGDMAGLVTNDPKSSMYSSAISLPMGAENPDRKIVSGFAASSLKQKLQESPSINSIQIIPMFASTLDATEYRVLISMKIASSSKSYSPVIDSEGNYFGVTVDEENNCDIDVGDLSAYGIFSNYASESSVLSSYVTPSGDRNTRIHNEAFRSRDVSCGSLLAKATYDVNSNCWQFTYEKGELEVVKIGSSSTDIYTACSYSKLGCIITAYGAVNYRIGEIKDGNNKSCSVLLRECQRGVTVGGITPTADESPWVEGSFFVAKKPEYYNYYGGTANTRKLRTLAPVSGNSSAFAEITSLQKYFDIDVGYQTVEYVNTAIDAFIYGLTLRSPEVVYDHPLLSLKFTTDIENSNANYSLMANRYTEIEDDSELVRLSATSVDDSSMLSAQSENSVLRTYTNGSADDFAPSDLQVTADGQKLFFVENSVSSQSDIDGNSASNLIEVEEPLYDRNEKADFGHSDLDVSGTGDNLFAAWTTQTQQSLDDNNELTENSLLVAANSSEITVAKYNNGTGKWTATTITDNGYADITPAIDSQNGKAVVAWFSGKTSGADSENIKYDIDANIMFSFYNGSEWGENYSAVNTIAVGNVENIEVAMLNDETAVIAYTVSTDNNGTEAYYSIVNKNGVSNTTCVTDDNTAVQNIQIIAVGSGASRRAVLAWSAVGDDTSNIRLLSLCADGSIDNAIPETVAESGISGNNVIFRMAGNTYDDLTVTWIENSNTIKAARLFKNGISYGISSPMTVIESKDNISYTYFDMAVNGEQLTLILEKSDSTVGRVVKTTTPVESVLVRSAFDTEAEYLAELANLQEQYPNGITTESVVPYSTLEKKVVNLSNTLTVTNVVYNSELVAAGCDLPVYITVRNDGFNKITGLTLTGKLEGQSATNVTKQVTLNPGESYTLMNTITFGSTVKDYTYTVSCTSAGGSFEDVTGTLKFNLPEISIEDVTITSTGNGKRGLQFRLANPNDEIHLNNNDKTVSLTLYADIECETQVGETITVNSNDFEYIDDGVLMVNTVVDLPDVLNKQGNSVTEFPNGGIELYAQATVEDKGETINSDSASTKLTALSANPFDEQVTKWELNEDGDKLTVKAEVTNNLLTAKTGKYVRLSAYNKRGLPLFYYYEQADFGIEETKSFNFTIDLAEDTEVIAVLVDVVDTPEYLEDMRINNTTILGWYSDPALKNMIKTEEFEGVTLAYAKWPAAASGFVASAKGDSATAQILLFPYEDGARVQKMTDEQLDSIGCEKEVTVDMTAVSDDRNITRTLYLPATLISKLADSGTETLRIKMQDGSDICFNTEAIKAMSEQTFSEYAKLSFISGDEAYEGLNAEQKRTVRSLSNPLVLDITLKSYQFISDLKGGNAEFTVPYAGAKYVRVWFVDEDGAKTKIPSTYDGTNVTFKASHFSAYVIESSETEDVQATFEDVLDSDYFYAPVLWAVENNITNGQDSTHFAPYGACTRAQMVTFLWRAMGSPAPTTGANPFTDVDANAYYSDAVLWAVENNITTGVTADTFAPNDTVTRAQAATFLYRCLKATETANENLPFTDVQSGAYYTNAVSWAYNHAITTGTSDTAFSPFAACTRAQIVTFLYRAIEK